MIAGTWVVAASFLSAVGTALLLAYVRRYRDKPGAGWFGLSLASQVVWSLAYGTALLVHRPPAVRWALEVVAWTAMGALIATFLAFVLEYTGRATLGTRRRRALVAAAPLAMLVTTATNPIHGLAWTGFAVDPVGGLATVSYDLRMWAVVGTTAGVLAATLASLLLFDTVLSYGRLYRREAVAVGLSTIPPSVALLVWLYGLGPAPQLNLATALFVPHVVLDAYAVVGNGLFEFHPATRRAGERAAIEDLGNPVVIVDERERIVTLNDAAAAALGVDRRDVLTDPIGAHLQGSSIDPTVEEQRLTLRRDGRPATYAVTARPLREGEATLVGYTIAFQDVTADIRREQRLAVLNRVLRHNLRNDMTVVRGFAAAAREADDDERGPMLDRVLAKSDELIALGESAREIERVLDRDQRPTDVDVAALLSTLEAPDEPPDVSVDVAVDPPALSATADPETLSVVLEALLDNAVRHGTDPGGTVTVTAIRADDGVAISVVDDGPGLPPNELAVLEGSEETVLDHGTGLGLWLVAWGAQRLGATVDVSTDDGTTVTLTLPAG